ncbi:MAG TPA: DUF1614 domain-containing protein [Gammaproteobacteria bacterium]|nr:DUF1614 domain-containing protein [Gammaproteobacteria bacterium]
MRSPFSPLYLLLFIFAIGLLLTVVQIGVVTIAFSRLGLSQSSAFLLLFASLFGSVINLPLFSISSSQPLTPPSNPVLGGLLRQIQQEFTGRTLIAINVGGGLIPIFFSLYLLYHNNPDLGQLLIGIGGVAIISYLTSRPVPGLGIGMPVFIAPISAALLAIFLAPEQSAPLAYISGTLGVLIGADLLRLRDIGNMGLPIAAIGGAGTFDGIFLTGLVAVLLA